jgi:hypothetical protein
MTVTLCAVLGTGLAVLGLNGLNQPGAHWVAWLDLVAAFGAFAVVITPPRRSKFVAAPFTIGIALFAVWFSSFLGPVPIWMTWWNFAFASLFSLLGVGASFDTHWDRTGIRAKRRGTYGAFYPGAFGPYGYTGFEPFLDVSRVVAEQRGRDRRGPKSYRRSDQRILEDVNDRLWDQWDIDASDIEIEVNHGEVYLNGLVDTRWAKRYTETVVDHVAGVKDVHNSLQVKGRSAPSIRAAS